MPDPILLSAVGSAPKGPRLAVSHEPPTRDERTVLGPAAEQAFQAWVADTGIEDVDHPDSHYDYRGYWLETFAPPHLKGDHFPDTFKQHGHESFSLESKYSRGPFDGGLWLPGKNAQGEDVQLKQPKLATGHLRPDQNARPPADVPSLMGAALRMMSAAGGLTASPTGAALGALADRPGDLAGAGRAAGREFVQRASSLPQTMLQAPADQGGTSARQELERRGVAVPEAAGTFLDLTMDPANLVAGHPLVDLAKVGVLGSAALAKGGVAAAGLALNPRTMAALAERFPKATQTLAREWPKLSAALVKHDAPVLLQAGQQSVPKALDNLVRYIYDATLSSPGTSTRPLSGEIEVVGPKSSGFMLGKYANQSGKTTGIPAAAFSPAHIKAFLERHADEFAKNPNLYLGTWLDKETQTVYLDVAQKVPSARKAVKVAEYQAQPKGLVRDPATGAWPKAQKAVVNLKTGKELPVGNFAEFVGSPEFQQRLDEMFPGGARVMNGKEWWNLYGTELERVYGKERVAPLAAFLASTSAASAPVHNLRSASEYMRRLIKGEPIIQPNFRIPATAVGSLEGHLGAVTPGDYNAPGTRMPMEQTRAPNLRRVEAGDYAGVQKDKMNDMFHASTGREDIGVFDRRWAKLAEDWERGIFADTAKDKLPGSMGKKVVSPYALVENAVREGAKRYNMPVGRFSAYVWEGIGDMIKRTGQLYGMKHPAHSIPEASMGFPGIFSQMVAEKAKAWGISVAEFEQRLREGNAELLTAVLATPVGLAAYRQWQSEAPPTGNTAPPPSSTTPQTPRGRP